MSQSLHFHFSDEKNVSWKYFNSERILTLDKFPFINKNSKIFTIGSCFAVEIRNALQSRSIDVFPKYRDITFDPDEVMIGGLPHRENLNYYNTFSIKQEFEKYHGLWEQDKNDLWNVADKWWNGDTVYQDPYRRAVYSRSADTLNEIILEIDRCMAEGIEQSDAFVITLGLIEVWKKKNDGRFACINPGYELGGGDCETEFHLSTYQENYDNLAETIRLIRDIKSDVPIILTVSPVPLNRTFTSNDVVIANMESKSLLRAVAGKVCQDYAGVHYFPSYEVDPITDTVNPLL